MLVARVFTDVAFSFATDTLPPLEVPDILALLFRKLLPYPEGTVSPSLQGQAAFAEFPQAVSCLLV